MMYGGSDNFLGGIITFCIIIVALSFSAYFTIDWLLIDDAIKVTEPIKPELEIFVKDNVVDTLYIYREP